MKRATTPPREQRGLENATHKGRRKIEIPDGYGFDQSTFFARIVGITPALMHNPEGMAKSNGSVKRSGKKIPTHEEEAEAGAYRLPDECLYIPARMIQGCMREAAKTFKDPANSRATMTKPLAASLIPPDEPHYRLLDMSGNEIHTYTIDVQRCVVQKAAIWRARPRIDEWQADVVMHYDRNTISPEMLAGILTVAGQKAGLFDRRPEKGGSYGRFSVETFEVEEV